MDNNENNSQEFAPQDGGYTKAPDSQGIPPQGQDNGQQGGEYQSSGQFSGQQGGEYQSSGQFSGQQGGEYQYGGQQDGEYQSARQFVGQFDKEYQETGTFSDQMAERPFTYMPPRNETQGFAIAGMVLGIVSIVCCCSPLVGGVTGVLGLIFSIIVLVQKRAGMGMAVAGVICAAIGLLLTIGIAFASNSIMEYINNDSEMNAIMRDLERGLEKHDEFH